MKTVRGWQIMGTVLYISGILSVVLSPVLFRMVVVPLLGWEFIVGKGCVYYNADHTRIEGVANPGAIMLWWVWIGMLGYVVVLLGKKMQVSNERPTTTENRRLYFLLLGIISLGWLLCQTNR